MQRPASVFTGKHPGYESHSLFPSVGATSSAPKPHAPASYPLGSDISHWCVTLIHELRSAKREFDQAIQSINLESTAKLKELQSDVRCCATAAARDHKQLRAIRSNIHGQEQRLLQLGSDTSAIKKQLSSIAQMLALSDAEQKIHAIEIRMMSEQIQTLPESVNQKLGRVSRPKRVPEATPVRRSLRLAARKPKGGRSKAGKPRTIAKHPQKGKSKQGKRGV